MRFRLGVLVGFGAGYYFGARAGRERYEQLNRWIDRTRNSEAYETAAEKARAVVDLTVERAKDLTGAENGSDDSIDLRTPTTATTTTTTPGTATGTTGTGTTGTPTPPATPTTPRTTAL